MKDLIIKKKTKQKYENQIMLNRRVFVIRMQIDKSTAL